MLAQHSAAQKKAGTASEEKKDVQMEWKKGVQAEQNISFSSQTSILPAAHPKNPDTFFSLP